MKRNEKNNGRQYPCDQCDYKATQKCNLLTHLKSKHEQLFPIINNWNEKNSFKLKQSFERVYSEEGVYEMANFPSNNWTEENSHELKKSFERAYRLKFKYGFHDLTNMNRMGMGEDDPLNSLLPSVRVSGQPMSGQRQQGRGRAEDKIEPKRGKKLKTRKNEDVEQLQREKPRKEPVGCDNYEMRPRSRGRRVRTRSSCSRKVEDRSRGRKIRRG